MERLGLILAAALLAVTGPALAQGQGNGAGNGNGQGNGGGNGNGQDNRNIPLRIEIESGIDFSRSALRGQLDGDALIDPQTGEKIVGPNLIDLGGLAYQGRARVIGKPLQPVRIDLPASVTLRSAKGAKAELTDFTTDIPGVAVLDANGELTFRFGARITTIEARGGNFRGRIPIRVEYF
jgi:hypothetical protein